MKKAFLILAMAGICSFGYAQPYSDRWLTQPVVEESGDSIRTRQVSVSTAVSTLVLPAVTDRSTRVRSVHNTGGYTVYIGTASSSTGLTSTGYDLLASTYSLSSYRTSNSGSLYGLATGPAAITLTVIEEYNSVP